MGTLFRSNWNLEVLIFLGEGETGVPGEKSLGAGTKTNNKLNPHLTAVRESNPGHIGGRRSLSPLRYPCPPQERERTPNTDSSRDCMGQR